MQPSRRSRLGFVVTRTLVVAAIVVATGVAIGYVAGRALLDSGPIAASTGAPNA
jgi:hypothetical protein